MIKQTLNKIIITGDSGRGKSVLATKISEKLGIEKHSTDDYFYEIAFTHPRDKQKNIDAISEIYKLDKWIVEGTTRHLLEPGLASADLIIYLKFNNIFSQWFNLIKRHFYRDNESITGLLKLMRHVFYKRYELSYKKGKMTHLEMVYPYKEKLVILSSFKQINDFIKIL